MSDQFIIEETNTILKECYINQTLQRDVFNTVGSIYRMNAPYAMGYLFTVVKGRKEIHTGMYCNRRRDVDVNQWDYFYDFDSGTFFKLHNR